MFGWHPWYAWVARCRSLLVWWAATTVGFGTPWLDWHPVVATAEAVSEPQDRGRGEQDPHGTGGSGNPTIQVSLSNSRILNVCSAYKIPERLQCFLGTSSWRWNIQVMWLGEIMYILCGGMNVHGCIWQLEFLLLYSFTLTLSRWTRKLESMGEELSLVGWLEPRCLILEWGLDCYALLLLLEEGISRWWWPVWRRCYSFDNAVPDLFAGLGGAWGVEGWVGLRGWALDGGSIWWMVAILSTGV